MYKSRDAMVRRAVARHIMQQVRHSRVAKHWRAHSAVSREASPADCRVDSHIEIDGIAADVSASRLGDASAAATVIAALAAAMSATRVDDGGSCT
ncbi:hypothetical protein GGI04_004337, partial [Coemansia thaxteri]